MGRILFFSITLVLAACVGIGEGNRYWPSISAAFNQILGQNDSLVAQMQAAYTPDELRSALRSVAQTLLNRDPTVTELQNGIVDFQSYQAQVKAYLNSSDFQAAQISYYQSYFAITPQGDGIDSDEPANLATYLVVNDMDFRQVLTANYCVQNVSGVLSQKPACSTFANPSDQQNQAAGVLTTQAFLKQTAGPFNIHRVNAAFQAFACRNYLYNPDIRDPGLPVQMISGTIKTFNCNNGTNCDPICYNCHRNLNSRAALYYPFDMSGLYNPTNAPLGQNAVTDANAASTVADILVGGAQSTYFGKTVSSLHDFAAAFSQNRDFRDCLAQRLTNQLLGRSYSDPMLPQMQDIRDHVDLNGFKVKEILLEAASHPGFVL